MNPTTSHRILRPELSLFTIALITLTGCDPGITTLAEKEPNNTFAQAQSVNRDTDERIGGTLSDTSDLDIFQLGRLETGQIISVCFQTTSCDVDSDVVIALFDADGELARLAKQSPCAITEQHIFSHQVLKPGQYDLAIAFDDYAAGAPIDYVLSFAITPADEPFVPSGQFVYLDFHGETDVWLGGEHWPQLYPLSDTFGPDTAEAMAEVILQITKNDYLGLDIEITSSYDSSAPAQPHTTIYVAGNSGSFLGLAESVDWYNQTPADKAIIFGAEFNQEQWSDAHIAQAIGNVASHELGHLLGLVHTDDDTEIMDECTPNNLLKFDQDFHQAPLADFPVGYLDAWELLELVLGLL